MCLTHSLMNPCPYATGATVRRPRPKCLHRHGRLCRAQAKHTLGLTERSSVAFWSRALGREQLYLPMLLEAAPETTAWRSLGRKQKASLEQEDRQVRRSEGRPPEPAHLLEAKVCFLNPESGLVNASVPLSSVSPHCFPEKDTKLQSE